MTWQHSAVVCLFAVSIWYLSSQTLVESEMQLQNQLFTFLIFVVMLCEDVTSAGEWVIWREIRPSEKTSNCCNVEVCENWCTEIISAPKSFKELKVIASCNWKLRKCGCSVYYWLQDVANKIPFEEQRSRKRHKTTIVDFVTSKNSKT